MQHRSLFRRTAVRVACTGVVIAAAALIAGGIAGGAAWSGAALGALTGGLLTAITVVALLVPWDRFPMLASAGVMASFAGKVLVMIGVVLVLGPHRDALAPGWFFSAFAAALLGVTGVEVVSLGSGSHAPSGGCEPDQDT
ncbi:hypothetical protein CWT12_09705 [Actinomyces sp. 432]|uniref:hypothetical protein n=2 Tax=unclassified Actinomyces TaxID=2609248 RepID=UPI001374305A|nr:MULTISPECIES: hypothetical protein [unclassified Actinomyces]NDR54514.1 hypothetical protein [Actinomyces sp. 565]QHO91522.1 hypothetical protein CWT12_09705 [Actinomyces sp. 432]